MRIAENSICQYIESYLYVMDLMENNFYVLMYECESIKGDILGFWKKNFWSSEQMIADLK